MKFKKYIITSFILLALLFSISAISAADLNDTDSMNVLKDNSSDVGSYMDFITESSVAGETFNLESDYKFDNGSDLAYVSGININKSKFVINGNNHIFDCANQARAFNFTGKEVEINNLIIKNGFCEGGSAILSYCELTLNNVTIINCSGTGSDNCGAVSPVRGELTVNNCKFIDNAGNEGAAIASYDSIVNIDNSTFISSSDKIIKGEIYLSESKTTIRNCIFLNTTSKYATAIFAEDDGYLSLYSSKFKNLNANKTAGAIAVKGVEMVRLENCEFDNVTSENNGGAVFIDIKGNSKDREGFSRIIHCRFNDCHSGFGGAILQLNGQLTIIGSNFTNNMAEYEGGAIYTSYADVTITNSKFENNILRDNVSYGGACYFDMGEVYLKGNTFENNLGSIVSTLYTYDVNMTLQDNYFNNPSNVTSIYAVYGSQILEGKNNFTNDLLSFNNTNYFYNFENTANPFIILNSTLPYEELPEKFDLRTYGWVSPVKDQGFMGSCWAFGNLAALESALMRYANVTYSLSVNNMVNTMLKYSKYGTITNIEGGDTPDALLYLVDWLGIFPEEYDGYDELGKISSLYITPNDIHIQNVVLIPARKDALDNDGLKEALIKYGALAVSHRSNFDEKLYYNPVYSAQYYYGSESANHMVCLVGWDDNYSRGNFPNHPAGDGAWIVKNSWGTHWGDGGYFYVSYYDTSFAKELSSAYIINNDTYNRIYQNDVGGDIREYKDGKIYANNFTADEDELIAAVGTYFFEAWQKYELAVQVNGIIVYKQNGTSKFAGYETIQLDKFVQIKKGDSFIIQFNNRIPVVLNTRIHLQEGKSFVSDDGNTWADFSEGPYAAIIKAYTISDINITKNLVKYYANDTPFVAEVDAGEDVTFEINGTTSTVKADANGSAKLEVDLEPGNYSITTTYNNISIVNYVMIKNTIISSDVERGIYSNYNYKLQVLNSAGNPLNNTNVLILVNNKPANYTTDSSGYITIPFTKLIKDQIITVVNPSNLEIKKTKIEVFSRFSSVKNIAMYYFDGTKFTVRIFGDSTWVGKNQVVTVKLNKKTYKLKTNAKGYITLKIPNTVKPGTYKLIASYKGDTIKKTVKVKQNLKTSKYTVKKSAKKLVVKATLKNGKTALKNKKITLKLNGKTITAKTNKNGLAKLTIKKNVINKLKAGKKYTMQVSYLKNTVKTTLKVKR